MDILKVATYTLHTPRSMSSAFEPHMNVFVDAQDKSVNPTCRARQMLTLHRALADMLAPYRGAKSRPSLEGASSVELSTAVLPSSTELFYFYGQNLEQCAKLSTKGPLFDLATLHRKWLRVYAGMWQCAVTTTTTLRR